MQPTFRLVTLLILCVFVGISQSVDEITRLNIEGNKEIFNCGEDPIPRNVSVEWFQGTIPLKDVENLEDRFFIGNDGSLTINPIKANDTNTYMCTSYDNNWQLPTAVFYLDVQYPAQVDHDSMKYIQYLPLGLSGTIECSIIAKPSLERVTWLKQDKDHSDFFNILTLHDKDIVNLNNATLLFTTVKQNHQGRYKCTPFNPKGTKGSSKPIEVRVLKIPVFTKEPEIVHQAEIGERVEIQCDAQTDDGTQKPTIWWQRSDGVPLPVNQSLEGLLTIERLENSDFGLYRCIASNEAGSNVTETWLVMEGTQPYAPYNLTVNVFEFSIILSWMMDYNESDHCIVRFRQIGTSEWTSIPVVASDTQITIDGLTPDTFYEIQILDLDKKLLSDTRRVQTLESSDDPFSRKISDESEDSGPQNVSVIETSSGLLITWQPPLEGEGANLTYYYMVQYKTDKPYKTLNKVGAESTFYLAKNLESARNYYFRVLAYFGNSLASSKVIAFFPSDATRKMQLENDEYTQIIENLCDQVMECDCSSRCSEKMKIISTDLVHIAESLCTTTKPCDCSSSSSNCFSPSFSRFCFFVFFCLKLLISVYYLH